MGLSFCVLSEGTVGWEKPAENESEVTDNTNNTLRTNAVTRALMLFLAILSLIRVILPDPVPGFPDDILVQMSSTVPLLRKSPGSG